MANTLYLASQALVLNAHAVLVGAKPGNPVFTAHQSFIEAKGEAAYTKELSTVFAGYTNEQLGEMLVKNLGVSKVVSAADAAAFLATRAADRVAGMVDVAKVLASYAGSNADLLAAKSAYVAGIEGAYQYAANPANLNNGNFVSSVTAGQAFDLKTGVDLYNGTSGNDVVRGVAGNQVGTQDQNTLNSGDSIDGGDGVDTLAVQLIGGNYSGGATIRNFDTIEIGTEDQGAGNARTFQYNTFQTAYEITGTNTVVYDQITAGEDLTVLRLTPTATGNVLPTLEWDNEAGSVAGNIGVTFREVGIAGETNLNVVLDDVAANPNGVNGQLRIARGIEKLTITSQGTTANTLNTVPDDANIFIAGNAADLVSENVNGNGTVDDSTLKTVVVKGAQAFGKAASVNTNDAAGETGFGLTNRVNDGLGDLGNVATNAASASNLISVAATVTEIDAIEADGGVAMRFANRADNAAVNVTFKGGKAADYIEFARGNVNATGGEGADTFAFLNSNLTNFDFGSADSIAGGAGSDTIQLGVNGRGTVVANTTEFNNKTGIDVLDLRGAVNNVTLADAFVAGADAGTFTVRTDKIYQTSATSTANTAPSNVPAAVNAGNVRLENDSVNTIVLTELADNRAIEFIGGSGSDRVVVDNASANQFTKLDGGSNVGTAATGALNSSDSLTVVNTAVLDSNDVANIKGFELLNLVETTLGNSTFDVTLSEAFVLANTSATATTLTIASITGTYGQRLGAGDTVRLEVSDLISNNAVKASVAARSINVQDLVNAGVTVQYMVNGVATALNTIAAGTLAGRFEQALAPAATLLDDVPNPTGVVVGGGAVVGATDVVVADGGNVAGTVANENFTVAANTLGVTINGAGGTNSVTFAVATTGLGNSAANVPAGALSANEAVINNIDTVVLANVANTITSVNDANGRLANITGGTAADTITVDMMAGGGVINLGAGDDGLTFNVSLSGAQTLTGGDGVDTLTAGAALDLSAKTVSGFENFAAGGFTNTMTTGQFASFANVTGGGGVTFTNGGTVVLTAANDTAGTYTLGGASTLNVTYASAVAKSVVGSAAVDTINFGTSTGGDTVAGGAGSDSITLSSGVSTDTVRLATTDAGFDTVANFVGGTDVIDVTTALVARDGATAIAAGAITGTMVTVTGASAATVLSAAATTVAAFELSTTAALRASVDFQTSTAAQIQANIEAILNGNNFSGAALTNGAAGSDLLIIAYEGAGLGTSQDMVVLRYQEGATAEASWTGELTVMGVFTGVVADSLTAGTLI